MPSWPRDLKPRFNTEPSVPGPLLNVARSGKMTSRSTTQIGRRWTETYLVDVRDNTARKLLATTRNYLRAGTLFTIVHQDHATPKGDYGGTPLVKGADQTGSTIELDAASVSVTNWARAGDLITFSNIAIAYEVTADTSSDGSGNVSLPISPPVFVGGSPGNNALVTTTGVTIQVRVVAVQFPETGASNFGVLKVTFQESF